MIKEKLMPKLSNNRWICRESWKNKFLMKMTNLSQIKIIISCSSMRIKIQKIKSKYIDNYYIKRIKRVIIIKIIIMKKK
jgi:hypothetical protein